LPKIRNRKRAKLKEFDGSEIRIPACKESIKNLKEII
jgi:hypothetical protein